MTPAVLHDASVSPPEAPVDLCEQFLILLGRAILDKMDDSLFSDCAVEATQEFAEEIWMRWSRYADAAQKRATLEAIARCSFEELDDLIERVEKVFGTSANSDLGKMLGNYFNLLPGSIRRACRRPNNPAGISLPAAMPLASGEDLLPLLPARMTRFQPGDRPWEVGEWELTELLEQSVATEVWKAVNLCDASAPPVALHFFPQPAARNYVRKQGADTLRRVQQLDDIRGVVPLQAIHDQADPPCLQYAYVEAAPLPALVKQWRETNQPASARLVAHLIEQLARILGTLHRSDPPLIHRHLNPSHILLTPRSSGGWRAHLANLGLGPCYASIGLKNAVNPYASPEQLRDEPPRPQDDVYALGVLWYQLLAGDLSCFRPGGSSWRRRFIRLGAPAELIELLECCFDDDVRERPADGLVLAERMQNLTPRPKPPSASGIPLTSAVLNHVGMAFMRIGGGTFWMGSRHDEPGRMANEYLRHEVTLSEAFHLAVTPVTRRQYEQVMGALPACFDNPQESHPDHPVANVSWEEAQEFCRRLTEAPAEQKAGRIYRLPSENEWECACRAGTAAAYSFGPQLLPTQACFAAQGPARVGQFPPNARGLFDMHGNVWEWCADVSPGNPAGSLRVVRGGSWRCQATSCRSASRYALPATARADDVGFRVVMQM